MPNAFKRFLFKTFVKKGVVSEVPYSKNSLMAPVLIIAEQKNFEEEKSRLIKYLEHSLSLPHELLRVE